MGRRGAVAVLLLALAAAACAPTGQQGPPAGLVLTNGKIVTVDKDFSIKQAVAIKDGTFVAVGTNDEIKGRIGAQTKVVDLKGRTVLPGLVDSHLHALRGGLTWDFELHWDRLTSLQKGLDQIAEKAKTQPPGTWIRVIGGWSEAQFAEKRLPTPAELDQIAPNHPVWVQRLYERAIFNSAAIKALGITKDTPNPAGGTILKDAGGNPFGVTAAGGINYYYPNIPRPTLEQQITSTKNWFTVLNRSGITSFIDVAGGLQRWPEDYEAVNRIHDKGELTVRVRWFMQPQRPGREIEDIQRFVQLVKPKSGDDMLRPLGVGEILVWGVFDSDAFGTDSPTFPPAAVDSFRQAVKVVAENGWTFTAHATRSKSAEQLLPGIEEVNRGVSLKDRRTSFAHLEDVTPQTMERIKALGGGITVQDRMLFTGEDALKNWGEAQARRAPPLQSLLKAGVNVGGGTDATRVTPYQPFVSLWWFVTGKTVSGQRIRGPEESVSRETALRLYTTGSAWFSGEEGKLGSIEAGKLSDLIVLSADYLTVPEDQIKDLESVLTIVGGKPVYAGDEFRSLTQ